MLGKYKLNEIAYDTAAVCSQDKKVDLSSYFELQYPRATGAMIKEHLSTRQSLSAYVTIIEIAQVPRCQTPD